MNRRQMLALAGAALAGCAPWGFDRSKTAVLFDGASLDQWQPVGNANWRIAEGALVTDQGSGFMVSKKSYTDFHLRAEFWASADCNSGIFIRCTNPANITAVNAYEVNIFDRRPDPSYGTGAIVGVAAVSPMPFARDRWNTFEITAQGPVLTVSLNGVRTVDGVRDARLKAGPVALQGAGGTVKFRRIEVIEA